MDSVSLFIENNHALYSQINELCVSFKNLTHLDALSIFARQGFLRYTTESTNELNRKLAPYLSGIHNLSLSLKDNLQGAEVQCVQFFGAEEIFYLYKITIDLFLVIQVPKKYEGWFLVKTKELVQKMRAIFSEHGMLDD